MPTDRPSVKIESNAFWRCFPAGMRRRWWLFRLADSVCRHWPLTKPRRGLLVIRMDGIGDMVLFRPSLDHYARAFGVAKSDITVIGCAAWAGIADEIFAGYQVICINEHAYAKKLFYRLRINWRVRRLAAKTVVSDAYFRRALMADSLVWVSGAEKSVVSYPYINEPTRPEFTYYLSQCSDVIDTGAYPVHELDRHAAFVSQVGGETITAQAPQLNWRDRPPALADDGPYVVLNPGSNEYGRRWPLVEYVGLANWLKELGIRSVFVGKADEKAGSELISRAADDDMISDLTGQTDLPGLMDILKSARLVVTNDTGPAHLAIGLGAPTVVIIGGGHFGSFVPYPAHARSDDLRFVYRKMDCYHCFWRCHKRTDPKASFPCVEAVDAEQVQIACRQLLERTERAVER